MADDKESMRELALSMYVNEPCRICGKMITRADLEDGAVFAGYSKDDTGRSAHKECWAKMEAVKWVHP